VGGQFLFDFFCFVYKITFSYLTLLKAGVIEMKRIFLIALVSIFSIFSTLIVSASVPDEDHRALNDAAYLISVMQPMEYTIPSGANLTKIAKTFGTTAEEIMAMNVGNPAIKSKDLIMAGYKIYVPVYPMAKIQEMENRISQELGFHYEYENNLMIDLENAMSELKMSELSKAEDKIEPVAAQNQAAMLPVIDEDEHKRRVIIGIAFVSILGIIFFGLCVSFVSSKRKQSNSVSDNAVSNTALMAAVENASVGDVLVMLNSPCLGNVRNPKTFKKLHEYVQELISERKWIDATKEETLAQPLKYLPGYRKSK